MGTDDAVATVPARFRAALQDRADQGAEAPAEDAAEGAVAPDDHSRDQARALLRAQPRRSLRGPAGRLLPGRCGGDHVRAEVACESMPRRIYDLRLITVSLRLPRS